MKRILSLLTFCAAFSLCLAQEHPSALDQTIQGLSQDGIFEVSNTVGYAGKSSGQYQRFQKLLSLASPEALINLAFDNHSPAVRLYALYALTSMAIAVPEELKSASLSDRSPVTVLDGCFARQTTVSALAAKMLRVTTVIKRL